MTAITYLHRGLQPFRIEVRVEGKRAGDIRRDGGAYFYRTKSGHEGERFGSIDDVKASLEGED